MIASLKNNLNELNQNIDNAKLEPVKQVNYKKKLRPVSDFSTYEDSDATSESSSDDESEIKIKVSNI